MKARKTLEKILSGSKNIRFEDVKGLVGAFGFRQLQTSRDVWSRVMKLPLIAVEAEVSLVAERVEWLAGLQPTRYSGRMPTIHREAGFVFYFYAEEGTEPPHVHVDKGDGTAKLWLRPLRLAWVEGIVSGRLKPAT